MATPVDVVPEEIQESTILQVFAGTFEAKDVSVLVCTDRLQLVAQADRGVMLLDCRYRSMRMWEDRGGGTSTDVVITTLDGVQATFQSEDGAEICAAIAQQACVLLGPDSASGSEFPVQVGTVSMQLHVTTETIVLLDNAVVVQTLRYQDIRSWSVDASTRRLTVWATFLAQPLQIVSDHYDLICELMANRTRDLAKTLAQRAIEEETRKQAAEAKRAEDAAKVKRAAAKKAAAKQQAAKVQELMQMITQAKHAEQAKDNALALERYDAALKWGVEYLEREPSARVKLKPTMTAMMERVRALQRVELEEAKAAQKEMAAAKSALGAAKVAREELAAAKTAQEEEQHRPSDKQKSAPQPAAAQSTQITNPESDELAVFLDGCRLLKYHSKLVDFGAETVDDLLQVDDNDLDSLGMRPLEKKRFFAALPSNDTTGKANDSRVVAAIDLEAWSQHSITISARGPSGIRLKPSAVDPTRPVIESVESGSIGSQLPCLCEGMLISTVNGLSIKGIAAAETEKVITGITNAGGAPLLLVVLAPPDNASTQVALGICYDLGLGVYRSASRAVECYTTAAAQGNAQAMLNLGVALSAGDGIAQDSKRAFTCFQQAAETGNDQAQFNLAVCYETGAGVAKDIAAAEKWYHKAAKSGHRGAMNNLALADDDAEKAFERLRHAVTKDCDDTAAIFNLALCYDMGLGVKEDRELAAQNYERAAAMNHAFACNNLGVCYASGVSPRYNSVSKAVECYKTAARQELPEGLLNLGLAQLHGTGTEKNRAQAMLHIRKAADLGSKLAADTLNSTGPEEQTALEPVVALAPAPAVQQVKQDTVLSGPEEQPEPEAVVAPALAAQQEEQAAPGSPEEQPEPISAPAPPTVQQAEQTAPEESVVEDSTASKPPADIPIEPVAVAAEEHDTVPKTSPIVESAPKPATPEPATSTKTTADEQVGGGVLSPEEPSASAKESPTSSQAKKQTNIAIEDIPEELMLPCKLKGKKRNLKIGQINVMIFDEQGTQPIESWLYERLDKWEYDGGKAETFTLTVQSPNGPQTVQLKMAHEDGYAALPKIQEHVEALVKAKKAAAKEERRRKKAAAKEEAETKAEGTAKETASDVAEPVPELTFESAKYQGKKAQLQVKGMGLVVTSKGRKATTFLYQNILNLGYVGGALSFQVPGEDELVKIELAEKEADEAIALVTGHMNALAAVIRARKKAEKAERKRKEAAAAAAGGDGADVSAGVSPASASDPAATGSEEATPSASKASAGSSELNDVAQVLTAEVFKAKFKGKTCKLKVDSMNVQVLSLDEQTVLGSWLYKSLTGWELQTAKNRLLLTVGSEKDSKSVPITLVDAADGSKVIMSMTQHAEELAKAAPAVAAPALAVEGDSISSSSLSSPADAMPNDQMFPCKQKGKSRLLKVGTMNVTLFAKDGNTPVESWLYERVNKWDYTPTTKDFNLTVRGASAEAEPLIVTLKMKEEDGAAVLDAMTAATKNMISQRRSMARAAKKAKKEAEAAAEAEAATVVAVDEHKPKQTVELVPEVLAGDTDEASDSSSGDDEDDATAEGGESAPVFNPLGNDGSESEGEGEAGAEDTPVQEGGQKSESAGAPVFNPLGDGDSDSDEDGGEAGADGTPAEKSAAVSNPLGDDSDDDEDPSPAKEAPAAATAAAVANPLDASDDDDDDGGAGDDAEQPTSSESAAVFNPLGDGGSSSSDDDDDDDEQQKEDEEEKVETEQGGAGSATATSSAAISNPLDAAMSDEEAVDALSDSLGEESEADDDDGASPAAAASPSAGQGVPSLELAVRNPLDSSSSDDDDDGDEVGLD